MKYTREQVSKFNGYIPKMEPMQEEKLSTETQLNWNDIRLNNLIQKYNSEIVKAELWMWFEDGFSPIPLTPEILEKAGFKKQSSGYRRLNNIILMYDNDDNCWLLKGHPFFKFQSLHQLQNLYHSLTGKELEINL
jgi:hypothetical protein